MVGLRSRRVEAGHDGCHIATDVTERLAAHEWLTEGVPLKLNGPTIQQALKQAWAERRERTVKDVPDERTKWTTLQGRGGRRGNGARGVR